MSELRNEKGQFNKGTTYSDVDKQNISESLKGNQNAKKLKTNELKMEAYKSYCAHLAKGKAKKSWYFQHPDLCLLWETMEKYIREEPTVFDPIQKEIAWAQGYQLWEGVVEDSATGANEKANTASLQMLMRNKYLWDKEQNVNKVNNEAQVVEFLRRLDTLPPPPKENLEEKSQST